MLHPIRIAQVRREADDAICLTLDVPPALRDQFAYQPGQYLTLEAAVDGAKTRRAYSICSGIDDPALQVAVKRVEGGLFSSWAHAALQPGHTVDVLPPQGRFTVPLDGSAARTYLGVAAGSGITPVLSILKSVLSREPASRFVLLYGSRSTAKILFREELEALKDRFMGRLTVMHILSREQQDIPVLNGRLDGAKVTALLPALLPGSLPDYAVLCGPGDMIRDVSAALGDAGMPPGRVLSEHFATSSQPRHEPSPTRPSAVPFAVATVRADGVSTAVPMLESETVLDAALRAGLDLPWSCHAGMCSTCRARVTDGAVAMDVNYGLEPWETEAGYVLTCQARPTTPTVTVDYDHA